MPELPEVETICRGLAARLEGRRLDAVDARVPALRFPLPDGFSRRLTGRRVIHLGRRAKYLLVHLDDGQVLIGHLGMSGRMRVFAANGAVPPLDRHDHVVFRTDDGAEIRFNDVRRFGFFDLTTEDALARHPMLEPLGPEPLGNAFDAETLAAALAGKKTPIKAALLDQRVVAGLGNIYVCEALYWADISPRRSASSVPGKRAERLVPAIRRVLSEAIAAGGSSLRDFAHTDGGLGYFQASFAVYGREGEACPRCAEARHPCRVRRIVQSGRSTFYCAVHQR